MTGRGLLGGVNVASVALMGLVALQLGRSAVADGVTAFVAVVATVLLIGFRVNSIWLVLAGGRVSLLRNRQP